MKNAKVEKRKIIIVISLIALISLLVAGLFTIFGRQNNGNSLIASAGATSSPSVFVNPDLKTALPQTTPGPSINKKIEVYPSKSNPKIKKTHPKVITQSTKEETKNPPTIHEKTTTKVVKKTVSTPTSAPVVVKPKPKPTPKPKKNGTKPKDSDWTKISPDVPKSLYDYNYTKFEDFDIAASAEIDSKGSLNMINASTAVKKGIETLFTVDYSKIESTKSKDKDAFLCDVVYWMGEACQEDICDYMTDVVNDEVKSEADFITDSSLIYDNGNTLVRGRLKIKYSSGASSVGLTNNKWYYKDVEVAVSTSSGEDRYGYGDSYSYTCLYFFNGCFNSLSGEYKSL